MLEKGLKKIKEKIKQIPKVEKIPYLKDIL